jgi:diacylglycerol kinase (ATP)
MMQCGGRDEDVDGRGGDVTSVGVLAHQGKHFGGGLSELHRLLRDRGFGNARWYRIQKSKQAPAAARRAIEDGIDLLLVWGGDGTAQRCLDVLAGSTVCVGLMPAGTANLLAGNLGIPTSVAGALDVALSGSHRRIDVGVLNGERFGIMAGAGADALSMHRADRALKDRLGKFAYVWTGLRAARLDAPKAVVKVDGETWFKGKASCLLFGNMGSLGVGLTAFPDARPDDGLLEVGVVTAQGLAQWGRVIGWILLARPERSKHVRMTRGASAKVKFDRDVHYELDGGARPPTRRLRVAVEPLSVIVSVP